MFLLNHLNHIFQLKKRKRLPNHLSFKVPFAWWSTPSSFPPTAMNVSPSSMMQTLLELRLIEFVHCLLFVCIYLTRLFFHFSVAKLPLNIWKGVIILQFCQLNISTCFGVENCVQIRFTRYKSSNSQDGSIWWPPASCHGSFRDFLWNNPLAIPPPLKYDSK